MGNFHNRKNIQNGEHGVPGPKEYQEMLKFVLELALLLFCLRTMQEHIDVLREHVEFTITAGVKLQ